MVTYNSREATEFPEKLKELKDICDSKNYPYTEHPWILKEKNE